jgi:hypothetical protein
VSALSPFNGEGVVAHYLEVEEEPGRGTVEEGRRVGAKRTVQLGWRRKSKKKMLKSSKMMENPRIE